MIAQWCQPTENIVENEIYDRLDGLAENVKASLDMISAYLKMNFLISQPKHMLWVLKRTVSLRWFF